MAEKHIPSDIIYSILVRTPASSLQRLKLVSKEWFRLISDQDFAHTHLTHQSRDEFSWGFFLNTRQGVFFMGGTSVPIPNPPQPMNLPGARGDTYVLGSCKGLVIYCSYGEGFKLHVANPITRESMMILPQFCGDDKSFMSASIGCGCDGGDIKVVLVSKQLEHTPTTPYICGILNLRTTSWREMPTPIPGDRFEYPYLQPVFARGALHWCYSTGVLSLDLGEEKFHQTEATFCSPTSFQREADYMEWDGCYAVVLFECDKPYRDKPYRVQTIWTLRDFGWQKQPDIDTAFFERLGFPVDGKERLLLSTTIRNGEKIMFLQHIGDVTRSFMYDLGRQVMTKFAQFDREFFLHHRAAVRGDVGYEVVAHVNSIISCSTSPSSRPVFNSDLAETNGIRWNGAIIFSFVFILSFIIYHVTAT